MPFEGPRGEEDAPPAAIVQLHDIGMAGRLHPVGPVSRHIALGQDRVEIARLVRPLQIARAIDGLRMLVRRAAFRGQQVIPAIDMIDMRPFRPDRIGRRIDPAIDQQRAFGQHLHRIKIELLQPQGAVAFIARLCRRGIVIDDPCRAIVGEIERGIDPAEIEPGRIAPRARRIIGGDHEIVPAFDAGVHDPELAIVMGNGRGEQPAIGAQPAEIHLARAVDRIADQRPVHQIGAVENRQAGKPAERGCDGIEIIADSHDRRIGMEAGDHRIAIAAFRGSGRFVHRLIFHVIETGGGFCLHLHCCASGQQGRRTAEQSGFANKLHLSPSIDRDGACSLAVSCLW